MNKPNPAPEPSMEEILASIRRIISDGEDPVGDPHAPEGQVSELESEPEDEAVAAAAPAESGGAEEEDDNILDLTEEMFVGREAESGPPPRGSGADMPVVDAQEPDVVFKDKKPEAPAPATVHGAAAAGPERPTAPPSRAPEPPSVADRAPQQAHEAPPKAHHPVAGAAQPEFQRPEPKPQGGKERNAAADALMSPATDATVAAAFGQLANSMLSQDSRTIEDLVSELLRPMLREWLDDNLPGLVERLVRAEIERVSRGR